MLLEHSLDYPFFDAKEEKKEKKFSSPTEAAKKFSSPLVSHNHNSYYDVNFVTN